MKPSGAKSGCPTANVPEFPGPSAELVAPRRLVLKSCREDRTGLAVPARKHGILAPSLPELASVRGD